MKIKKTYNLILPLILLLLVNTISYSQNSEDIKDSTKVYRNIYDFSRKSKTSELFYHLFFKSLNQQYYL